MVLDFILDLIYPPKCMICDDIIQIKEPKWICKSCVGILEYVSEPICEKCGVPTEEEKSLCTSCVNKDFSFCRNYSPYEYEGAVRAIIHKFKYGNNPQFGKGFAKLIVDKYGKEFFSEIDILIGVPMHKKKIRKRGFNQADILATEIGKLTGVESSKKVLIRKKNTKAQSSLTPRARRNNLKDAFEVNKNIDIKSKNIMIVDDIYTTGSTLEACSAILLKNGAKVVNGLTLSVVRKAEENNSSNNIFEND